MTINDLGPSINDLWLEQSIIREKKVSSDGAKLLPGKEITASDEHFFPRDNFPFPRSPV